jgi:hypothetical protein
MTVRGRRRRGREEKAAVSEATPRDAAAQSEAIAYWTAFQRISGTDLADLADFAPDTDSDDDAPGAAARGDAQKQRKRKQDDDAKTASRKQTTSGTPLEREETRFRAFVQRPIPAEFVRDARGRAISRASMWRDLYRTAPNQNPKREDYGRGDRFALAALTHSAEWRRLVSGRIFNYFFGRALDKHLDARRVSATHNRIVAAASLSSSPPSSSSSPSPSSSLSGGDSSKTASSHGAAAAAAIVANAEIESSRGAIVGAWIEAVPAHLHIVFPELTGALCDPLGSSNVPTRRAADAADAAAEQKSELLPSPPLLTDAGATTTSTTTPTTMANEARRGDTSDRVRTTRVKFERAQPSDDYVQIEGHAAWCIGRFARSLGVVVRDANRIEEARLKHIKTLTFAERASWSRRLAFPEMVAAVARGTADAAAWTAALTAAVAPFLHHVPGLPRMVADCLDF